MKYDNVAIPAGAVWSSPFVRWQGALADVSSIDVAAAVTARALADRSIDVDLIDELVLGITIPQQGSFSSIEKVPKAWDLTPTSVAHVVMPLFHIAGSGWGVATLATGATMVLHREIDPSAILRDIESVVGITGES